MQEAPPLKAQLELFVAQFLGGEYVVHHSNARWQSISALVHRSIADRVAGWQPDPPGPGDPWSNIPYYPWGGIAAADREEHALYRHPLLLSFTPEAGKELRIMVLHTKSKFSRLKTLAQWEAREREAAVYDAHNDDTGPQRRRELRPSDHKPVSVVLNY